MVTSAGYLRYPHLNDELLTFVADDDVWLAPAAGGQHPPGPARGFGPQGLAEVPGGPRERRPATAAGRGRGSQMTIGVGVTAQGQGDPAGQQVRLGGVAGAERIQLGGRPVRLTEQPG